MTEEQITEEALRTLYGKLDDDDEKFLRTAIVMMLKAVVDKSGVMLIVPSEDRNTTGMLCAGMDTEEVYEELTTLAQAMMEELGTVPSPKAVQ